MKIYKYSVELTQKLDELAFLVAMVICFLFYSTKIRDRQIVAYKLACSYERTQ